MFGGGGAKGACFSAKDSSNSTVNPAGLLGAADGLSCGLSPSVVGDYRRRVAALGLTWPEIEALSDAELAERVCKQKAARGPRRPLPDFAAVKEELRKDKDLTLMQVWEEYRAEHPEGYEYSQFAAHYAKYVKKLPLVLRQNHPPGYKGFADYAGRTVPIVDLRTGEILIEAQVFVACLGSSGYTYAEHRSNSDPETTRLDRLAQPDMGVLWRRAGDRVVDNLKSGVTKAHRYEPEVNSSFAACADHYDTVVIPARPYRARDKGKVEKSVQLAQRWILAALRKHVFTSLSELNMAIAVLLEKLNNRAFQKMPGSRRELFWAEEKAALKTLPATPYEHRQHYRPKVAFDYHVSVEKKLYSVPWELRGEKVDVFVSGHAVEIFHEGTRIYTHVRNTGKSLFTTIADHMPPEHDAYANATVARYLRQAAAFGPHTVTFVERVLATRRHREQGYRTCQMLFMALGPKYTPARVEAACRLALELEQLSGIKVETILKHRRDKADRLPEPQLNLPQVHENIRGEHHYV